METVSVLQQQLSHPGAMTERNSIELCLGDVPLPVDYPAGEMPQPGRRGSSVKKHLHKHNLKHRYELQETLGRGTYGKVKKAIERHTGRVVSDRLLTLFVITGTVMKTRFISSSYLRNVTSLSIAANNNLGNYNSDVTNLKFT